jgi:hypothetical protein
VHKGIVYLLHGTGGNASTFVNDFEGSYVIKELVNNCLAVIITEAEEVTTGMDANGDGKLRWTQLPIDTVANVDYAHIWIITDTFYNRAFQTEANPGIH